jgi:hypothetical protein
VLRVVLIVVVLIVGVLGGIVLAGAYFLIGREPPPSPGAPAETRAPVEISAPSAPAAMQVPVPPENPFAAAATEYQEAKTALEVELEKQATDANPEIIEPVKENLGIIERAVMEVTMALAENPESEPLQQRLLDMYDEQIQLLRKALRLTSEEE